MCGICGILGFDGPSSSDRSQERVDTMLEALRGLNPSQIEKVMDYITLLKLAEKGRRRTGRSCISMAAAS